MTSQEYQKFPSTFLLKENSNNWDYAAKLKNKKCLKISSHILKKLKSLHADAHFEMHQLPASRIGYR